MPSIAIPTQTAKMVFILVSIVQVYRIEVLIPLECEHLYTTLAYMYMAEGSYNIVCTCCTSFKAVCMRGIGLFRTCFAKQVHVQALPLSEKTFFVNNSCVSAEQQRRRPVIVMLVTKRLTVYN